MSYDVKFLKGTAAQYNGLASKNENTFYYVDQNLYLGTIKLSNAAEIAAAVERIAINESEIDQIQAKLQELVGSETGSISDMINEAVNTAKEELQSQITTNKNAIDAINNDTTGILAEAKKYADGKDSAIATAKKAGDDAQADVNALKEKVGTVAEGKTVVEMIAEAQEAATYDDTSIKASIKSNTDAITVLNGDVNTAGSVDKKVADAVAKIVAEAPEAYDTLQEIAAWIADHPEDTTAMNEQININKTDIANLKALVGQLPEGLDAKVNTIVKYIDSKIAGVKDWTSDIATAKSEAISTASGDATTKANQALADAKSYADGLASNYATAAQGTKADSALQQADIKTGTTNGSISVKGTNVAVKGLGSAAYANTNAFDASGSAKSAETNAKNYVDAALTWGTIA